MSRSNAIIEFKLDGTILTANENFLEAVGYTLAEIRGQHHRMFVEAAQRESAEYRSFWARLAQGHFDSGEYQRIAKGGREIWLQATYNPIFDAHGRPFKVVKYAADITASMLRRASGAGQLAAIDKAQAVIEFELDGTIRTANNNFLRTMGYTIDSVRGKHHSLFVTPAERESPEYRAFWAKLGRGEYDSGQYQRIANGGREIWLQASYNPILDSNGKPLHVVKYATDITEQVSFSHHLRSAVSETRSAVEAAANGDLTRRINISGKTGDLETLSEGVNSLIDLLASIIRQIRTTAGEVRVGVEEMSVGNSNLSQRTSEQAASLEETAASMEEMATTVKQTADNASQANQLAIAAQARAEKGGDQGRGFAVVANEVRNLAGRSATAAKEIKALIQESVDRVAEGSRLVDESGRALQEIVAAVKKVTDIVGEIAAASSEQSTGIDQVNRAVSQMDETTQQNASLVEEAAATTHAIVDRVNTLDALISKYALGEQVQSPVLEERGSTHYSQQQRQSLAA